MSKIPFPKDKCMICNSSLDKDYWCDSDYCYRQFGYCYRGKYADFNLLRTYWGEDDRTKYFVEYHQQDNLFVKAIVKSANRKTYGEIVMTFNQPFDFNKYSAREIMEKLDKLITFK